MKKLIYTFFLLSGLIGAAQYGIDGGVAGAGHLVLWDIERTDLEHIQSTQDYLISLNVGLALEQAKLLDMSKQRYKSLSEKDSSIENASTLAQIITHGNKLFETQESIFTLTDPYPEIQILLTPALTDLIIDQGYLVADVVQATTDGNTNLMDSSQRLLHLKRIVSEIDKINILAVKIYNQARALIAITDLPDIEFVEPMQYDFTSVYEQLEIDIANLINPE